VAGNVAIADEAGEPSAEKHLRDEPE